MQTWNSAVEMSTTLSTPPQLTFSSPGAASVALRNMILEEAARAIEGRAILSDFPRDEETLRDAVEAVRALKF